MEATWAPKDDPVFKLTPDSFHAQASALYAALGKPVVSLDSIWVVYAQLLNAFESISLDANSVIDRSFHDDMDAADDHFEVPDIGLLPNQRDLRYGDMLGTLGYQYLGGLGAPPPMEEVDEIDIDPREFADYAEFTDDENE